MEQVLHKNWVPTKFIGKGSYGSVHIAVQQSNGSQFAVKSAPKTSLPSIQALDNEISTLRYLSSKSSSPFIVKYYGHDETPTHKNLHLEYLPRGDVSKSYGVSGADVELIRSYTWCLVMALKEVHVNGFVHCDVKGSNVLVGSTRGVVKLCDFGSSIRVNDDDDENRTGKIVPRGSPFWMAPEVVRGESQGCESDIWSLGCTVIEMFSGLPAWRDCGPATLAKIGYSDELPEYPMSLPEVGKDFLNKCLVRNPKQRWSCDELLEHPFLVPINLSLISDNSPRSVFDLNNIEFSSDDEEENAPSSSSRDDIMDRIGKLASTSRVNWESEGWVDVRSVGKEKEEVSAGTSCEYSNFEEGERGVLLEFQEGDYPTWNINLGEECNTNINDKDDVSIISGGDGFDECFNGYSCGSGVMGENIKTIGVFIDELIFYSSVLLFIVLFSSIIKYIIKVLFFCKYEFYILYSIWIITLTS